MTINIKVIALVTVDGLSFVPIDFNLFSIREPYNCPPSKGPIGSALNIPTLKLINHNQNNRLETTGKYDPNKPDSYFDAIESEYGTGKGPSKVGGVSKKRYPLGSRKAFL
jgi:hypothetical protein